MRAGPDRYTRYLPVLLGGALGVCVFGADRTTEGGPPPAFVHPGILVTRAQLDFVKGKIAAGAEPWASAAARAKTDKHGALTYTPHPPLPAAATDTTPATDAPLVLCGSFSDPDVHCTDEKEDGIAAYTQALLWYLSGDEAYGQNAIAILDAWSTLTDHRLSNASLQAGWMGTQFARAAEIMQMDSNWPATDVAAFKAMVRRAFLPRLLAATPWHVQKTDPANGTNGNWDLSLADSLVQIGVLLDDRDIYETGIGLWRDRVPAYCYYSPADGLHPKSPCGGFSGSASGYSTVATRTADPYGFWGQAGGTSAASTPPPDAGPPSTEWRVMPDGLSQETCRDLEHVQYGLAALVNVAETARIQGTDLYGEQGPRLAACMEFAALYVNLAPKDASGAAKHYDTPVNPAVTVAAQEPSLCPNASGAATVTLLNTGSLGNYVVQPTWEIGYNALATRLRLAMPLTKQLLAQVRSPPPGWVGITHHMGWETLTHGDVGAVGLPAPSCGQ